MSRKTKGFSDFSELEALSTRIALALQTSDREGSTFDKQKLIRKGGYILMDGLIRNTPIATKESNPLGSNWYRYTYRPTDYGVGYGFSKGTRFGDTHYRGTLARGWVARPNEMVDRPPNRKPTLASGKVKVDETDVVRKGGNVYSLTFVNATPYSMYVEKGHRNKVPRILGGDGTKFYKFTEGKYFTEKTVNEYREKIGHDIGKEYFKMMKTVFKGGNK